MSLTSCLHKAKDTMNPTDFDAVLARAQALEEDGVYMPVAERRAIQEVLDGVQAELEGVSAKPQADTPVVGLNIEPAPVDSFGWHEEDDAYVYHVTSEPAAENIAQDGFYDKAKKTFTGGSYPAYSKGKVFFTDRSGVKFWLSRVEDQLFDQHDEPPEAAVVRVLKSQLDGLLQVDKNGTDDAKHPAWYVESKSIPGNGNDINQSAIRASQTESPAFKKWFGGSKILNKDGTPRVVYHGSVARGITEFNPDIAPVRVRSGPDGTYFTDSPEHAGNYTLPPRTAGEPKPQRGSITAAYLKLESPLNITAEMKRLQKKSATFMDAKRQALEALDRDLHDGVVFDGNGMNAPEYIVFKAENIKSATGNNGDFDSTSKDITQSAARPMFYSQLQTAIESIPDRLATMAAPQWKLWLDANAGKLGVKKEEVEWSGVKDYLTVRGKDKVTREEVAAYLADNGVKVQETVLGAAGDPRDRFSARPWDDLSEAERSNIPGHDYGKSGMLVVYMDGEPLVIQEDMTKEEAIRSTMQESDEASDEGALSGNTKYHQYTLPGGENYRELLITLPSKQVVAEPVAGTKRWRAGDQEFYSQEDAERAAKSDTRNSGQYKSSHWDQANVLAHLRVDDRTDSDGNKVLMVQEIQSDWGQDGKKKGFSSGKIDTAGWSAIKKSPATGNGGVNGFMWQVEDSSGDLRGGQRWAETEEAAVADFAKTMTTKLPPPAPFIGKTEAWVALALKRAIIMAAQGGYDKVAFVTGQQAADFFDLSKQVDMVSMQKLSDTYSITAYKDDRELVNHNVQDEAGAADVVGKEVAAKLFKAFSDPRNGGIAEVSGDGLKVGGEGMRSFYDTLVPQVAREVLKKIGGGKMEDVVFGGQSEDGRWRVYDEGSGELVFSSESGKEAREYARAYPENTTIQDSRLGADARIEFVGEQPGFAITPAMREKVAGGLPLFSAKRESQTETQAFKQWFGADSTLVNADGSPMTLYHGTDRKFSEFRRSKTGAMGPAVYLGDDRSVAESYDGAGKGQQVIMAVYARGKYLGNMQWTDYINQHGWTGAEAAAKADGWSGVYDTMFENAVAVWDPSDIKSAENNNGEFDASKKSINQSTLRDKLDQAINQPSLAIVGQTSRTHTPEQLKNMREVGFQVETPSLKQRYQKLTQGLGKRLAQGLVDQFAPIRDLDQNAYLLTRLSKGASGAFESFLRGGKLKLSDGVYDFDEQNKGGVVDKLLIPLGGEHHDFLRWIAANRAERLTAEGKENLFSPENIRVLKTLADGQTAFDFTLQHGPQAGQVTRERKAIYQDSLKTFNAFSDNIMDLAEQSGLIDGESRHLWEQEFYVPFYRVADDIEGGVRGMGAKGSMVRQEAFKKLKGGKNALNADLLDNTLMNWAHLLDASAKNRAAKATLEAAQNLGVALEANEETVKQMGKSAKTAPVWFMEAGRKRHFIVEDPMLLTAISSLEYAGMRNPVMNAMGAMKHILTVGVTASPYFKIRNLIRDSVQVLGTGPISYNPAKNIADGWKLTDPKSDAYFRLLAGGGTIHFGTMLEGSEAKRVQRLVESGVDDATILNDEGKVQAFYRSYIAPAIEAYNETGNRSEAMNRAALYDQLTKGGMSHAEASLMARDLMDFSMQGSFTSIRFLTQVVPFLNARLQGLYKLGKAAHEDPKRMAIVTGAVALTSLALLAAYGDDDDWKKREDWDRNGFWWFQLGGKAFRIPKPFELGAIGTLAERGFEFMFDKEMTGQRLRSQVLALLGDNLAMNPIPQLFKPVLDVYANKDSFSGRPIESMGMEKLKPEYRFTDRTSMAARGASTALNAVTGTVGVDSLSPVQIEQLLRGYFGWLGSFVVGSADVLARPLAHEPVRAQTDLWKAVTGSIVSDLRDAPSRYVSAMYDQAKDIEQAYGTHRMLLKAGKTGEAAEFQQEHQSALSRYRNVESAKQATAKLNTRAREIERSDMTAAEKREALRQLQIQKDAAARRIMPQ